MSETSVLWSPFLKDHIINPYPMYEELRVEDPVHKSQTGEWILTRYHDVKHVLTNGKFIVGNRLNWFQDIADYSENHDHGSLKSIPQSIKSFLLFKNPPEHRIWREILSTIWPKENDFETIIKEYSDKLLPARSCEIDIVTEFARPLAAAVIGKVLGLQEGLTKEITEDGFQLVKVMDLYLRITEVKKIDRAATNLTGFFKQQYEQKDNLDKSGVLYKLLEGEYPEFQSEENSTLTSLATFLFIAGLETTSSLITLNLFNLIKNPGHLITIKKFPGKIPKAIEELTRYDSPVQLLGRIASKDVTIDGRGIMEGDTLTLAIGSANRDPDKFKNPHAIDFNRDSHAHLSFGAGPHHCLGDRLAKLEAHICLEHIVSNFREFEILEQPDWEDHLSIRRLKNLKISLAN